MMTNPKLISANFVKNEAHCIERMLDSVQPYVEDSYILVDSTTTDNTADICERRGCKVDYFEFENFGKVWNTLLKWISGKSDWSIFIAPDETISKSFSEKLKPIVEKVHPTDVDGVWFSRRHWTDLDRKNEYAQNSWYPDWQLRLIRNDYPRIYLKNYVHEWPQGLRKTLRMQLDIDHFNMYWKNKMPYDFEAMNTLYNKLALKQKQDGGQNIWPD